MLVLSRKVEQQLVIAENVVVTVLGVKGQVVRLGIEAPEQVRILRREVAVREAGQATPAPVSIQRPSAADRVARSASARRGASPSGGQPASGRPQRPTQTTDSAPLERSLAQWKSRTLLAAV